MPSPKNNKRLHQFGQFLVQTPNQSGTYTIGVKDNAEDSKILDGKFDNNFFSAKSNAVNYQMTFEALSEYGVDDIDFILHELREQQHENSLQSTLKKVFFVNYDCHKSLLERPRVYFNYGYTDNLSITNNEREDNRKINASLRLLKPFFFECDRDLAILDPAKITGTQVYSYDYNAYYNSTQVYDFITSFTINPNDPNLTVYDLKKYFECCEGQKYFLYYKDFFNIGNLQKREATESIAQRRDNKTLIVPLYTNASIITNTDRSAIQLPSQYPAGWTGGKLDLNTSRKSEIMVLELDATVPQNYSIKITNEENKSYLKFTWLSSTSGGQTQKVQIYPHLGTVYANEILANPLTDYTLEVDERYGSLYFDSLYNNPAYPAQLGQQTSQTIMIEQSQAISNTLYIQTLKTFY